MTPATELATIPLVSGATIEDADSPAGKIWHTTLDTVSQQEGFQRCYWGREVENPSVLQLFVDWDSLDAHKKFIASPIYEAFGKHLMTIVDGPLTMLHANLTPHPATAALGTASPVTEVLTVYVEKEENDFVTKINQLAKVISENADGYKGVAGGWVIEDVEYKGKKGKAYVVTLGWESVEAHMAFRETAAFKENIHLIRDGPLGMELHHTEFVVG